MFRLILTERARPGCLIVDATRPALRRRGAELQRPRPHAAGLRADVVLVPDTCRRGSSSTASTARRTVSARSRRRDPDPEWLAKGETLAELAARDRRSRRRARGDGRALQRGRRRGERPRLRPRQLPLRPLHRRARAARAGAVLRLRGASRVPRHEGRAADGRRRPRALDRRRQRRSRASTRRATRRRARSASPTPAPAARSARPSCSASEPATRRPGTDPRHIRTMPRGVLFQ